MSNATINRVETTTLDTRLPVAYYTCTYCGYRDVMSRDSYCPGCGKHIEAFYTKKLNNTGYKEG